MILRVGCTVTWTDNRGQERRGVIRGAVGDQARVLETRYFGRQDGLPPKEVEVELVRLSHAKEKRLLVAHHDADYFRQRRTRRRGREEFGWQAITMGGGRW